MSGKFGFRKNKSQTNGIYTPGVGTPDPHPGEKEIAPEDILPTSKIQAEENNLWRIIHVTVRGYSALFIRLEFQGPSSPYSRPWRGLARFANKSGTDTCTNRNGTDTHTNEVPLPVLW